MRTSAGASWIIDGLAAARARGQRLSRPPMMTPEKIAYALALPPDQRRSIDLAQYDQLVTQPPA